ncbi:NAC domain-containing protein 83 isoform X2 [Nicotiana tabacum]|uniref:NAC domain-containing protein 41 isoform X2 n=2 Tax=Nicotiana TaxID=4085 RepID=A0A1S3Z6P2_TOBAC|nr:PREDICTED: NAC domain-containing protein 68-like isoform X2 [Nicotiana sylvestris]XP_016459882.1 PREDICTED: NAC domain-containing protein 41-like isoform X2 [Nicotiana tabacum]
MEEQKECAKPTEGAVGSLNLPIGFRFRPTDEELLIHYLSRKIFSMPLPALIIPEILDVFDSFPSDLPGDLREKRYFFSKANGDINSKGCSRLISGKDCSGYWKAVGQGQLIVVPISGSATTGISHQQQQRLLLGMKKVLRFYQTTRSDCLRTRWIMHQYSLVTISPSDQNVNMMQVGDWSVFRVYQKKLLISKNLRTKSNGFAEQCNIKTNTRKRPLNEVLKEKEVPI